MPPPSASGVQRLALVPADMAQRTRTAPFGRAAPTNSVSPSCGFSAMASAAGVGDTGNALGTAWGDYDNDGDLDLYVANNGQANVLYRNNADGTFTNVTAQLHARPGHAGTARGAGACKRL